MWHRRKEKKQQEEAQKQRASLEAKAAELLKKSELTASLADDLSDPAGLWDEASLDTPIVTKRGEEIIYNLKGMSLTELRTVSRTYQGASHGMSIRIAKGVYYRPSVHGGKITESSEVWKAMDIGGSMVITNQRIVYRGTSYSREFLFSKLLSFELARNTTTFTVPHYLILLPVSNRVRTSAVAFRTSVDDSVREMIICLIQCGISMFNGTHDGFLEQLRSDAKELRSQSLELSNQAAAVAVPPLG